MVRLTSNKTVETRTARNLEYDCSAFTVHCLLIKQDKYSVNTTHSVDFSIILS